MIIEIISPEKKVELEDVAMITLPAYEGKMGILSNHAPAIVILERGELLIKHKEKTMTFLLLNKGVAHITPTKTVILLENF